jgi:nicotinamide mononucleotide adenylyltransferase
MTAMGVIHGRFQPLHNDHLVYILAGKERCRHLVVGITNPDPSCTRDDPADPQRSRPADNPLTYFERMVMVGTVLLEAGVPWETFSIVPFPINVPELYRYYVPMDAVFYLTIYDRWGERKLGMLKSLGLRTEVMWERPSADKGLTAAEIRKRMLNGEPWDHLVPEATARLMNSWDVPVRLRQLVDAE